MGKRYHCEYCDKHMVASPSIIKTHNKGLAHQKLVQDHYQQFRDPKTILKEESKKQPCIQFFQGRCSFGSICWNSHYTREQLDFLREYVSSKNQPKTVIQPSFEELYQKLQEDKSNQSEVNTILYDKSGMTHVLPWTYNNDFDIVNLPPSLKKFKIEDFENVEFSDWG